MPPRTDDGTAGATAHRVLWTFIAGVVCLQAAWILSVPAFRGIDEIDHAHRAASVARGQFAAGTQPVTDGRGGQVRVPESFVLAAVPACEQLRYVGRGNCHPVTAPDAGGNVGIASAASAYMPLYYALVGWPSLFLTGEQALYGMRLASMVLCDVLLALAVAMAWRNRSSWFVAALMVCLTPTVIYATIIVAPNGLSMAGGLLMWLAWAGADRVRRQPLSRRRLWVGTLGAVVCCLTHNTGPVWVLLTLLILSGLKRPWRWPKSSRRSTVPAIATVLASMAAALTWALVIGTISTEGEWHAPTAPPPLSEVALRPVSWLFQSVFGAPRPGGFAEPYVYGVAFTVLFLVVSGGFVRADRPVKLAMMFIAVVLVALPLALTALTYENLGFAWQGRYSIPLGVGITILASGVLSDKVRFTNAHLVIVPALAVVAVGGVLAARANVADEEAQFLAPLIVAPTLSALGCVAWISCLLVGRHHQRQASFPDGASPVTAPVHDEVGTR